MINEIDRKKIFDINDIFKSSSVKVFDASAIYEYVDNIKTDTRVGTYLVVVDLVDYTKYKIKMPLSFKPFDYIGQEVELERFDELTASIYVRSNRIFWSMKANGIN